MRAVGDRVRRAGRAGVERLRTYLIVAVQAGLAAALAWLVAREVLGNPDPTFAPAAAVGVIAAALGGRTRRTVELVVGVVLGIVVGDVLIHLLGTGPWQTGVVVFLAVGAAVLVRGTGALVTQAGGTAVLVATLTPVSGGATRAVEPRQEAVPEGGRLRRVVGIQRVPVADRVVQRRRQVDGQPDQVTVVVAKQRGPRRWARPGLPVDAAEPPRAYGVVRLSAVAHRSAPAGRGWRGG